VQGNGGNSGTGVHGTGKTGSKGRLWFCKGGSSWHQLA
jgi:hypothetical protein